jgi:hypothetical protein
MRSIQQQLVALTFIAFLSTGIMACNNNSEKKEEPAAVSSTVDQPSLVFDKLVGTWQSEDGKSFERWTKNTNGSFRTAGFSVKGSDTSWNEQGNVYSENDHWIFENTVKGQNDGKAVKFTSTILTDDIVQFSNPAHDFPTDINYTVPDANTINAFIVGPNANRGKDTIPFNFTRVK